MHQPCAHNPIYIQIYFHSQTPTQNYVSNEQNKKQNEAKYKEKITKLKQLLEHKNEQDDVPKLLESLMHETTNEITHIRKT